LYVKNYSFYSNNILKQKKKLIEFLGNIPTILYFWNFKCDQIYLRKEGFYCNKKNISHISKNVFLNFSLFLIYIDLIEILLNKYLILKYLKCIIPIKHNLIK